MRIARYGWLIAGLAVMALVMAACGGGGGIGGGSDEDKIKARVKSIIEHTAKADAKGLINDFPPDERAACNEAEMAKALAPLKAFNVKHKETKVVAINGDRADVSFTVSAKILDKEETETSDGKLVKVNNEWYGDTEGQSCGDFVS
jgi:hypothetical protein